MLEFLPQDVQDGLNAARRDAPGHKTRMRVKVGGQNFALLRYSDQGFAVLSGDAPRLRGHVDLYDGSRHIGYCLIVASGQDGDEMLYEFKRNPPVTDRAPLDFAPDEPAPTAGVIGRDI